MGCTLLCLTTSTFKKQHKRLSRELEDSKVKNYIVQSHFDIKVRLFALLIPKKGSKGFLAQGHSPTDIIEINWYAQGQNILIRWMFSFLL